MCTKCCSKKHCTVVALKRRKFFSHAAAAAAAAGPRPSGRPSIRGVAMAPAPLPKRPCPHQPSANGTPTTTSRRPLKLSPHCMHGALTSLLVCLVTQKKATRHGRDPQSLAAARNVTHELRRRHTETGQNIFATTGAATNRARRVTRSATRDRRASRSPKGSRTRGGPLQQPRWPTGAQCETSAWFANVRLTSFRSEISKPALNGRFECAQTIGGRGRSPLVEMGSTAPQKPSPYMLCRPHVKSGHDAQACLSPVRKEYGQVPYGEAPFQVTNSLRLHGSNNLVLHLRSRERLQHFGSGGGGSVPLIDIWHTARVL